MRRIQCAEIWGGNNNINLDAQTGTLETSLSSRSAKGDQGGDFYYYSVCSNDWLSRIIIGDVVGHGEVISHISDWVYQEMQAYANSLKSEEILRNLNNRIVDYGLDAMSTAAIVTHFSRDRKFRFSYAGHHPILIRRKNETAWWSADLPVTKGMNNLLLGLKKDVPFHQEELELEVGDSFFLYTDGIIEAMDDKQQLLGKEGLMAVLNQCPSNEPVEIKNAVQDALDAFCGGVVDHDDITMIAAKIL
jgi:phosphoserine phosphatase RsbU/P